MIAVSHVVHQTVVELQLSIFRSAKYGIQGRDVLDVTQIVISDTLELRGKASKDNWCEKL